MILFLAASNSSAVSNFSKSSFGLASFSNMANIDFGLFLFFSASFVFDQTSKESRSTAAANNAVSLPIVAPDMAILIRDPSRKPEARAAANLSGNPL